MISFIVYGHPQPQGSTRAFIPKGWKRPIITSANAKNKPWRQEVAGSAIDAMNRKGFDAWDREVAVFIRMVFFLSKPKSAPKKRQFPTVKPDLDKLERSILDALTGVVFTDDSQVVKSAKVKLYGEPERVEIHIYSMDEMEEYAKVAEEVFKAS